MLGRRKKVIECLRKQNDALKAEKEALNEILDTSNEECRKLQLQIWNLEEKLAQERKNSRRQEQRLRAELLEQAREILVNIDSGQSVIAGNTGCFLDPDTVTWKVVTVESGRSVDFNSAESARFYYMLHQAFKMRPDVRESMECYLKHIKKSA